MVAISMFALASVFPNKLTEFEFSVFESVVSPVKYFKPVTFNRRLDESNENEFVLFVFDEPNRPPPEKTFY